MRSYIPYYDIVAIILYILTLCLSAFTVIYFVLKSKRNSLFYSFILIQAAIIIWSSGLIAESIVKYKTPLYWYVIRFYYLGICFIGFLWLFFCINYTETALTKRKKFFIGILGILPVLFYASLLTNDFHNMFYVFRPVGGRRFGILFWIHCFFSYSCVLAGTVLLIKHVLKNNGYERKQAIAIVISGFIPLLANIAFLYFRPSIEITPLSFIISLVLLTIATFKYKFLNIVPVSLLKFVDFMDQPILVLDNKGRVENYNPAFRKLFLKEFTIKTGDSIEGFVGFLRRRVQNKTSAEFLLIAMEKGTDDLLKGEVCFACPEIMYFYMNIQPVLGKRGQMLGRVVSFTDVKDYKTLLGELNEKNTELSAMNEQLREYVSKVGELAVAKERNQFARDVHDSVGHTMTLLISLLGVCKLTLRNDMEMTDKKLDEALKTAREGLDEIRNSIKGLSLEKLEVANIADSLEILAENFKRSGVDIDLNVSGSSSNVDIQVNYVVFRTLQEALTNSVRHGKATKVMVCLQFEIKLIKMFIIDNGIGCKKIVKGMGLCGMEERVRSLGGTIVYGSDGELGFNIHIEIPLREEQLYD